MSAFRLDLIHKDGSLDLVSADGFGDFWFETLAAGLDLGSPQAVKVVRQSLMRDGSDSAISRYDNRTVQFQVAVNAPHSLGLQDAERTLALATAGRAQLSWTPPDGIGATTVFEVLNATIDPIVDDLSWVRPGKKQQVYLLTLECEPFGRSSAPVTVNFAPASPTFTTLDDGSVAGNWSNVAGHVPVTLSAVTWLGEASIKAAQPYSPDGSGVSYVRWSGTVGATPFVAVDLVRNPAYFPPSTSFAGMTPVAIEARPGGYTRYYFPASTNAPDLRLWNTSAAATDWYIGGVYTASTLPSTGVLAADIPGSVRTQGVVTISGATALGDTMVYCDPTMMSHGWQPDEDSTWPQAPEGSYMIYRKDALSANGGTFTATAGGQTVTTYLKVGAVPNNSWFPVGRVALGGLRSGRLGSSYSPLTETNTRIFRIAPDTSLTFVRGLTQTRLLIDLPSLDYPRGGVWAGAAGSETSVLDSTDAWEFPTLTPPTTAFFIRADGAANASSTATFYPRAHTFNAWGA